MILILSASLLTYVSVQRQESRSSDVVLRASVQAALWCDRWTSRGRPHDPSLRRSTLPTLPIPTRLPPASPPTDSTSAVAEHRRPSTVPEQVRRWTSPGRCHRRHHCSRLDASVRVLKPRHVTLTGRSFTLRRVEFHVEFRVTRIFSRRKFCDRIYRLICRAILAVMSTR